MKTLKLASKFIILFALFFSSCTEGPTGPQGPEGPPGPEILPVSFEFNATMLQETGFESFHEIPAEIDVFDSDMILLYVLEDFIEEENLDVWRQLPLTEFTGNGTLLINFDFTLFDIRVFLDANYPLGSNDGFDEVLMRAVHIPADFLGKMKSDSFDQVQSLKDLENLLGVEIEDLGFMPK